MLKVHRRPILALVTISLAAFACSVDHLPAPSPTVDRQVSPSTGPSRSIEPAAVTPAPPTRSSDGPVVVVAPPPYRIVSGGLRQEPQTILFGDLTGDVLAPFSGFPLGFTIDRKWGFGAFFGRPAGTTEITITLNRQLSGVWRVEWSDVKGIDPTDTGYAANLVAFKEPGLYRLDVTAGSDLFATSLMRMEPPCVGTCTGG